MDLNGESRWREVVFGRAVVTHNPPTIKIRLNILANEGRIKQNKVNQ